MGSIWGGFAMEVILGFDLGWICSGGGCGFRCGDWFAVHFLDLDFIDVGLAGFCGRRWLLGFIAGGGGGFQYKVNLKWGWIWVSMWW